MTEDVDVSLEDLARHFDVHDPRVQERPFEVLDYMRERAPVSRVETHGGHWALLGYEAVTAAALDPETFSSAQGTILAAGDKQRFKPNECDLPELRPWRNLMAPYFTRKATEAFVDSMDAVANKMIDEFASTGKAELIGQYAKKFVHYGVFTVLFGFDAQQTALCVAAIDKALFGAEESIRQEGWSAVGQFCYDFWESKKGESADGGLVDAIRTGTIDGEPISREDFIGWAIQMIAGGVETTPFALGNLFVHLAQYPDARRRAAADSNYIQNVIDESLRFEAPAITIARTVTTDTTFQGCPMRAGEKVLLVWPAANRDEALCPHPDEFDAERGSTRHLAFGAGVHRCVGERFALAVMTIATKELLARIPDFRIDESAGGVRYVMGLSRGPVSLPIAFP